MGKPGEGRKTETGDRASSGLYLLPIGYTQLGWGQ